MTGTTRIHCKCVQLKPVYQTVYLADFNRCFFKARLKTGNSKNGSV